MELCIPVSHACGNTLHLKTKRGREQREHETVETKKAPLREEPNKFLFHYILIKGQPTW